MRKYLTPALALVLPAGAVHAQQFVGLQSSQMPLVYQASTNPAFVNDAQNEGIQIHLFSGSGLFGTNAYRYDKESGAGISGLKEGPDYTKDGRRKNKHLWANAEILGPAVTFSIQKKHNFGVYTRMRQIVRGGNVPYDAFRAIGDFDTAIRGKTLDFTGSGFTVHSFGEIGFSYGRVLIDDLYRKLSVGITVKYLAGMAAGSIYTDKMQAVINGPDSIQRLQGDLSVMYTNNINNYVDNDPGNDLSSWFDRAGKGSLGLDIGISYEYRPDGDPNKEERPYLYRVSASITDIGGIGYKADTGSSQYQVDISKKADWQYKRLEFESYTNYLLRLSNLGILRRGSETESFRVGLPTAFRLNGDYRFTPAFYMSCNILLNLKGSSSDIYKPGYVSYFNVTPRYERKSFMVAMPFTYIGYQTMTLGAIFRAGPLYLGSSSIISSLLGKELKNADGYAGVAFRLKRKNSNNYY